MFKFLSISLLFLISFKGISQDSIAVHFIFPSADVFEIRVDEADIYDKKNFYLTEGRHKIEIWVQGLELKTDSILVNPSSYNLYQYSNVKVNPKIAQNKKDRIEYTIRKSLLFVTYIPTGIVSYLTYTKFKQAKVIYSDISNLSNAYTSSLDLNFMAKTEHSFDFLSAQYIKRRRQYVALVFASSAMLLSNIGITYLFHKFYKKPGKFKPVSPFGIGELKLSIYPTTYGLGLNLKL
ncbi:hypothetical protein DNU06_14445 [Putridiphycobacter roseus]|uniref:Uncharacterized protein n=1 Tax=Putridiphycobacter roseus TaxID=2219161 RepID=A0A2W1MY88_9FLAO|nr:hypothetical protein [Putridiphycobacter roseus]PZE16160.1 hypothetical protein DNU06_14445 [Putridiphycobacter roseus]